MAKKTLTQRNEEYLMSRGLNRVTDYPTTKKIVFRRPDGEFYFLGKAGSVRRGRTIGDSHAVRLRLPPEGVEERS